MADIAPDSYSDPASEYERLRSAAAVVDRSAGGAVLVTGADARTFLDSLVSQDLAALAVGEGAHSLLLQPQGKLTADFRALRVGPEEFWLDTDIGVGAVLAAGLNRFKIRVNVDVRDVSAEHGHLDVLGPDAVTRVATILGVDVPAPAHAHVAWRDARVVRVAHAALPGGGGISLLGPRATVEDAGAALVAAGVARAGLLAAEAVRIEAGIPRQGLDLDESLIPQEAFLDQDAVSFTKGCFLGQELVCRIDTRGHVNRQLRGIAVTGDVVPAAGAALKLGDRDVGRVTSAARSPRLGVVALALVRREVEPPAAVTVMIGDDAVAGEACALPFS